MTTTTITDAVRLQTRIPEGREIPGLTYGSHVSAPGRSGYHVQIDGSEWGVAWLTPSQDELAGSDEEIVEAISAELVVEDGDIRRLRSEAASAGDDEQVELCDRALSAADPFARTACSRAIVAARAERKA